MTKRRRRGGDKAARRREGRDAERSAAAQARERSAAARATSDEAGAREAALVVLGGEGSDDVVDVGSRAVHLLDERRDGLLVGGLPGEALTRGRFDLLTPVRRRIGGIQHDQAIFLADRHHLVGAGDLLGKAGDDLLVELNDRDVRDRYLTHGGDGRRQLDTADAMTIQERRAELEQVAVGICQCRGKCLGVELPTLDERLADRRTLVR